MRKVIVAATLALSPMLHAQANSPAQPQQSSTPTLQSKLIQPATLSGAAADSTVNAVRVSTGVEGPKLIHTVSIASDGLFTWNATGTDRKVVLTMIVDERGKPSNLQIVQSAGPVMDSNVLEAVSQYRFKPGTLDNQPTAVPVTLNVILK